MAPKLMHPPGLTQVRTWNKWNYTSQFVLALPHSAVLLCSRLPWELVSTRGCWCNKWSTDARGHNGVQCGLLFPLMMYHWKIPFVYTVRLDPCLSPAPFLTVFSHPRLPSEDLSHTLPIPSQIGGPLFFGYPCYMSMFKYRHSLLSLFSVVWACDFRADHFLLDKQSVCSFLGEK